MQRRNALRFMVRFGKEVACNKLAPLYINQSDGLNWSANGPLSVYAAQVVTARACPGKACAITGSKVDCFHSNRCREQRLPKRFWQALCGFLQSRPVQLNSVKLVEKLHRSTVRQLA